MALVMDEIIGPDAPTEAVSEWILEDVDLGGVAWNLRLCWNDRAERWQLDMEQVDGDRAQYGIRMVPNWPLGASNIGRQPEGVLLVLFDFGDDDARDQCTYEGLGHRWKLVTFVDDGVPVETERNWRVTATSP